MRRLVTLAGVTMALVAAAACADSEEFSSPVEPELDAALEGDTSPPDAGERDVVVASDAPVEARGPQCSSDGWCETVLPGPDFVVRDIWPLPDRAFAVAESANAGLKVLEWTSADSTWRSIDDNSQNESLAESAVKIWAPNADEIYYAVSPARIFHGKRPVPPATVWAWTRSELLADNNTSGTTFGEDARKRQMLGVWGAGDDVYAWFSNTIYRRRTVDGAEPTWVPEFVANDYDDPSEYMFLTGAAGTSPDDVWFMGLRGRPSSGTCRIIVRKTAEGYRKLADGVVVDYWSPCAARGGVPLLIDDVREPPYMSEWPVQFQSADGHTFFSLEQPNKIFRIKPDGETWSWAVTTVPGSLVNAPTWSSFWGESPDRLWLSGTTDVNGNWGIVVRGDQVWEDGSAYEYSSIARNGMPTGKTPNQIRGTSNTNLWAVGDRYALHKTTP